MNRFTHFSRMSALFVVTFLMTLGLLQAQDWLTVKVEQPGTLKTLLEQQGKPFTDLKVKGAINGDDMAELRRLAGGAFGGLPTEQPGIIKRLHLKFVTFHIDDKPYSARDHAFLKPDVIAPYLFVNCQSLETIVLPKNITLIDEYAFMGCTALRQVSNLDAVETIEWGAFKDCSSLQDITLGDALTTIRGEAFLNCTSLEGVNLPESLVDLGSSAFSHSGLRSVYLRPTLNDLGNAIFKDCAQLQVADIQSNVDALPFALFSGCSSLTRVELSDQISILSESSFEHCTSLRTINLPEQVQLIQGYAFFDCPALQRVTLRSPSVVVSFSVFNSDHLPQLQVVVPETLVTDYQSADPWRSARITALPAMVDAELFTDDFSAYEQALKEWQGSDLWQPDHGTYMRSNDGNAYMQLGDNEGDGMVRTKPLDLSRNGGDFYIRFRADGWNDFHRSVMICVHDQADQVVDSLLFTIPRPGMGQDMKNYEVTLRSGSSHTVISFATSPDYRIVALDDIAIGHRATPAPYYHLSTPEPIDFGRVAKDASPYDHMLFFAGHHLTAAPKVKLITQHPGALSVDYDCDAHQGQMRVMLMTDEIGTYDGWLRVSYDDCNQYLIPIRATVYAPDNYFGLDASNPVDELSEDFEDAAKLPQGWANIALVGDWKWRMRNSGGINGNRYPAIDALGDTDGDVHALLVLPALKLNQLAISNKELLFDLAVVQANGAQLRLVWLDSRGYITELHDFTASTDHEWTTQRWACSKLSHINTPMPESGFLAFEYIGHADDLTTIYRIDNVRLGDFIGVCRVDANPLSVSHDGGRVAIDGMPVASRWQLYNSQGGIVNQGIASEQTLTLDLRSGIYLLRVEQCGVVKLLIP